MLVAGALAVAGCSGDDDGGSDGDGTQDETPTQTATQTVTETETQTDTATQTPTETATPEATPAYSISAEAPDSVSLNEEFTYSVTIENVGNGAGTATVGLDISVEGESGSENAFETSIDLEAGESETIESDPLAFERIFVVQWEFYAVGGDTGEETATAETEILSAVRSLGEDYLAPTDARMRVTDLELKKRYEYEDFQGETASEAASDGMQWAFLWLEVENQSGQVLRIPTRRTIVLLADTSQFEASFINKEEDRYEGGEVQPGVIRDGWIAYEIPADITQSDLRIIYSDGDFEGDWRAEWRI